MCLSGFSRDSDGPSTPPGTTDGGAETVEDLLAKAFVLQGSEDDWEIEVKPIPF